MAADGSMVKRQMFVCLVNFLTSSLKSDVRVVLPTDEEQTNVFRLLLLFVFPSCFRRLLFATKRAIKVMCTTIQPPTTTK